MQRPTPKKFPCEPGGQPWFSGYCSATLRAAAAFWGFTYSQRPFGCRRTRSPLAVVASTGVLGGSAASTGKADARRTANVTATLLRATQVSEQATVRLERSVQARSRRVNAPPNDRRTCFPSTTRG